MKISRRDFLKKAAASAIGLGIGAFALKQIMGTGRREEELWEWSKEAYHYSSLGGSVQCGVCPNKCMLEVGQRSFCRNKVNIGGKLYTVAYGNPCSVAIDPMEKKPLFHFLPATKIFSVATAGCNFRCKNCQNWNISQFSPEETRNYSLYPEQVVSQAKLSGAKSIAYTYSEPTAFFEYMYDTSKIARSEGIKNVWVTNGYMSEEALSDFCSFLDAANVDLKFFNEKNYNEVCAGRLAPVLDTLKLLKERGVWFEVTHLVIPTINDDLGEIREMCAWLVKNLGPDTPLHFSRFHPNYKLVHIAMTPKKLLDEARGVAMDEGINNVYIGNVPGTDAQNTYCPSCKKTVIERKGYSILQKNIDNGACRFCGEKIAGVFEA